MSSNGGESRGYAFLVATGVPGVKSANEEWFATDYDNPSSKLMQIIFFEYGISVAGGLVQYTLDGGLTFHDARNGELTKAGSTDIKQIVLPPGAQFNMRSVQAVTLDYAYLGVM